MRTAAIAAIVAMTGSAAVACSAVEDDAARLACYDDAHADVSLIRCTDIGGTAKCDILTPSPSDLLSCTIYGADGKPIARESAFGGSGLIIRDMAASDIDHIDCVNVM